MRMRNCLLLFAAMSMALQAAPLRVGVVGLVHGHVKGFLRPALARADIQIVGYAEPDASVAARYVATYKLNGATVFNRVEDLLDKTKPEAVVVFTNTFDDRKVVELCAARGILVMMEKPLAVASDQPAPWLGRQERQHPRTGELRDYVVSEQSADLGTGQAKEGARRHPKSGGARWPSGPQRDRSGTGISRLAFRLRTERRRRPVRFRMLRSESHDVADGQRPAARPSPPSPSR